MAFRKPSKEALERLRTQYPQGTRVELVSMDDPYSKLKPGDRGTVSAIDDTGTVFVDWDSGSGLGLVYGEDHFKKVEREMKQEKAAEGDGSKGGKIEYADGGEFWRDTAASHGLEEATLIMQHYFSAQIRNDKESENQFDKELFAAFAEGVFTKADPKRIVYPYDFAYAKDRLEESYYHDSRKLNNECAEAIDKAINGSCYARNYYNLPAAVRKAVSEYGFERVNYVVARQIQRQDYDGRYSVGNKAWAAQFDMPEVAFERAVLNAHPTLIDGFVSRLRDVNHELGAGRFSLPGRDEAGSFVNSYEVGRSILFDTRRGFAVAHCPVAPSPYVTWQFTVENGKREFYWGSYFDDLDKAERNFKVRVGKYMRDEGCREVPNPVYSVEVATEQNFNMIDGSHNNIAVPKPDLTDGQTHEELRELAPGKASVLAELRESKKAQKNTAPKKAKVKKEQEAER